MIQRGMKLKPYPGDAVLRNLYEVQRFSTRACGRVLSVQAGTIRRWLEQAGIKVRSIAEGKRGQKPAAHTVEASVRARRKRALPGRPAVGYKVTEDGYVLVQQPSHPNADSQGYVREHRLVLERKLGRYLLPSEDAHHLDKDRGNNHPDNLALHATRAEHLREHYAARAVDKKTGRFLPR